MATLEQVSAGGIVCRRTEQGDLEVALIATHDGQRWALPKGLTRKSESLEETAVREVREETGLEADIVTALDPIDYWFWWGKGDRKRRHHKTVHYFIMRHLGGDTALHDHEVDDARWFSIDEAIQRASYRSEKALLEQLAAQYLDENERFQL